PPHRHRPKSVTRTPEGLNADRTFGWPRTTSTQSGSFCLSATFRAETSSPVLSAGVTVPSGVLGIPRHHAAADGASRRHRGRRVRRVRSVPGRISAADRMILADYEIDDEHDHEADDGPQQGPDDEEDDPHRRVHPAALGVPVHPEGPRDQDRETDHADSYEEEQQSARQNLESCLHSQPTPHVPESILGYRDAARPCATRQAFQIGTFRVVLSVFAPLTGVLLTLSLRPQCSHSIQIRVERYYQLHVGLPRRGHVSGWSGRRGPLIVEPVLKVWA